MGIVGTHFQEHGLRALFLTPGNGRLQQAAAKTLATCVGCDRQGQYLCFTTRDPRQHETLLTMNRKYARTGEKIRDGGSIPRITKTGGMERGQGRGIGRRIEGQNLRQVLFSLVARPTPR